MRLLPTLMFLSVFAAPALVRAEAGGAGPSHAVAAGQQPSRAVAAGPSAAPQPAPAPAPLEDAPRTTRHWYGWQSLSTDAAALALLIAAGATSNGDRDLGAALAYASLGTYLLGGPATHAAHENGGRALGSLVMRAGLPIASGAIGSQLESCSPGDWFCGLGGAVVGGLLGIVAAVSIDAAVLGYEDVPIPREGMKSVDVSIGRDHALIVAGGSF